MKRIGFLYEQVYDMDNLKLAHKNAKKGKGWYKEVEMIDNDEEKYLSVLQEQLKSLSYETSEYTVFDKVEGNKLRKFINYPTFRIGYANGHYCK